MLLLLLVFLAAPKICNIKINHLIFVYANTMTHNDDLYWTDQYRVYGEELVYCNSNCYYFCN